MKNVLIIEAEVEYVKKLENIFEHAADGVNVLAVLSSAEHVTQWLSGNTLPGHKQSSRHINCPYKTVVLVSQKNKIIPLPVKDIACFYFNNNILGITMLSNQKYYMSAALDDMEKMLDPCFFFRANRQFLINKVSVVNAERFFARKLAVTLTVDIPATIIISKARSSAFLKWLEGI